MMDKETLHKKVKGHLDVPIIIEENLSGQDYHDIDIAGGTFSEVNFSGAD
jgi:uncharacterized Fe-S center protein